MCFTCLFEIKQFLQELRYRISFFTNFYKGIMMKVFVSYAPKHLLLSYTTFPPLS